MIENSTINGWNIKMGDYVRDTEEGIKIEKRLRQQKRLTFLMKLISGLISLLLFLLVMQFLSTV